MKELVKHLMRSNLSEIVEKSLLNCHVKGLHSIMLLNSPEKRIRLYITGKDHELYSNLISQTSLVFPLAFHPHHCDLTIHVIKGQLTNWVIEPADPKGTGDMMFGRYLYSSAITKGKIGFSYVNDDIMTLTKVEKVKEGESLFMKASEIHSVSVNRGVQCAWFVYEGKEDNEYAPISWSRDNLEELTHEGLYVRPTEEQVINLLREVGLI